VDGDDIDDSGDPRRRRDGCRVGLLGVRVGTAAAAARAGGVYALQPTEYGMELRTPDGRPVLDI
jgi:hypothetical protein